MSHIRVEMALNTVECHVYNVGVGVDKAARLSPGSLIDCWTKIRVKVA